MRITQFLFVFLFESLYKLYNCHFDLEHLQNSKYNIDFLQSPIAISNDDNQEIENSLTVVSKFGQRFQCIYPNQIEEAQKEKEEETSALKIGIKELLKPLENGPCLYLVRDWWSYEFCYGKYIRQYHVEDNKISGEIIYLGYYESEFNWDNNSEHNSKNHFNRYHSQFYSNGSKCDLTGMKRKAEVRFLCDHDVGDRIDSIYEPETCVYTITIRTIKICHHPYLKSNVKKAASMIQCKPIITQEQFNKYEVERIEWENKLKKKKQLEAEKINDEKESKVKVNDDIVVDENIEQDVTVSEINEEHEEEKKSDKNIENKEIEDDESEIIEDFDKGIEDMKLNKDEKVHIYKSKDKINKAVSEEFEDILSETQDELQRDGYDIKLDKKDTVKHLSKTLANLLKTLEKNEKLNKNVKKRSMESEKLQEETKDHIINNDDEKSSSNSKIEPPKDNENVESSTKLNDFQQRMQHHFKKAGIDTNGRKVSVKIISAKTGEEIHAQSDEMLNKMIIAILSNDDDEIKEKQRIEKLQLSYDTAWNKKKSFFKITDVEDNKN